MTTAFDRTQPGAAAFLPDLKTGGPCRFLWDEIPSAADTFSDVTAVAVTIDLEMMLRTNALPEVACGDD